MIGFSEGFHDSAIAVVNKGKIRFATHSERYSKKKHDRYLDCTASSTAQIINMEEGNNDIAFYEKPLLKFNRLLETYVDFSPKGFEQFRKARLEEDGFVTYNESLNIFV